MNNDAWADALREAEAPELRDPGLWARCFAEAEGDEQRARAAYVKAKVSASQPAGQAPISKSHMGVPIPESERLTSDIGYCPNCAKSIRMDARSCFYCDTVFSGALMPVPEKPAVPLMLQNQPYRQQVVKTAKSRGVYIILGLFFGLLGIHNFYAGRFGYGIAQLLITAILGWFVIGIFITAIWVIVELFVVKEDGAGDLFA